LQRNFKLILDELALATGAVSDEAGQALVLSIMEAGRIFVAGAGRSGLAMRAFAMRLMHLGFDVHVVGDVTTPSIGASDLLLIGSGSGSTDSLLSMAGKARTIGSQIALITIRSRSPIADLADIVLTIPAPTPKIDVEIGYRSVQPMGSLFEQSLWLTLDALSMAVMQRIGADGDAMFGRHANLE
jgi:6-phospho-3-hexuloisomerase